MTGPGGSGLRVVAGRKAKNGPGCPGDRDLGEEKRDRPDEEETENLRNRKALNSGTSHEQLAGEKGEAEPCRVRGAVEPNQT